MYSNTCTHDEKHFMSFTRTHPQLMDVVHGTVHDVEGLHSKLDRKTSVETRNMATCNKMQKVHMYVQTIWSGLLLASLPGPAFRRLQYGKAY